MIRYLVVGLASGLLFGALDGVLHANPFAVRLMEAYKPIARVSVNMTAGILIDLVYGFALAGIFLLLYHCLPGKTGPVKGLSFAAGIWFLRVVMNAASTWMAWKIPLETIGYSLAAGLLEMAALGVLYGIALAPQA
jgi:hypothetical protein